MKTIFKKKRKERKKRREKKEEKRKQSKNKETGPGMKLSGKAIAGVYMTQVPLKRKRKNKFLYLKHLGHI